MCIQCVSVSFCAVKILSLVISLPCFSNQHQFVFCLIAAIKLLFSLPLFFLVVLLGLQPLFLLHGKDLHLDVEKFVKLDKKTDLLWKFNYSNNIAKHVFNTDPVVFDNYEGRAELFGQNDSLLVRNVQHNDSGDYTAVTISGKEQKVAEYKVIVQGRFLFSLF